MPVRIFKVRNQRRNACALISMAVINELLGLSGLSPEELEAELRSVVDQEQDGSTDEKTDKIYEQKPEDITHQSRLKLAIRKIVTESDKKFDEINATTNGGHLEGFTYDTIIELCGQKKYLEARSQEYYWPQYASVCVKGEVVSITTLLETFKSFVSNPFKPFGMMLTGNKNLYRGHTISITVLAPEIIILFDSLNGEMKRYSSFEELFEHEKEKLGSVTEANAYINSLVIDVIPVRPELQQKISAHGAVVASAEGTVVQHAITSQVSPKLEAPTISPAPHLALTDEAAKKSAVSPASGVKTVPRHTRPYTVKRSPPKKSIVPPAKNTPTNFSLLERILLWLKSILNAIKNFYKDSEDQKTTLRSSAVVRPTHAMRSALKSAVGSNRNGLPTRRARFASSVIQPKASAQSHRPKLVQR